MCNSHVSHKDNDNHNHDGRVRDDEYEYIQDRLRKSSLTLHTKVMLDPNEVMSKETFILDENERKRLKTEEGYVAVY